MLPQAVPAETPHQAHDPPTDFPEQGAVERLRCPCRDTHKRAVPAERVWPRPHQRAVTPCSRSRPPTSFHIQDRTCSSFSGFPPIFLPQNFIQKSFHTLMSLHPLLVCRHFPGARAGRSGAFQPAAVCSHLPVLPGHGRAGWRSVLRSPGAVQGTPAPHLPVCLLTGLLPRHSENPKCFKATSPFGRQDFQGDRGIPLRDPQGYRGTAL